MFRKRSRGLERDSAASKKVRIIRSPSPFSVGHLKKTNFELFVRNLAHKILKVLSSSSRALSSKFLVSPVLK